MWPSFVILFAISVMLLLADWLLDPEDDMVGSPVFGAIILAMWIVQLIRWGYRTITMTYRLTSKHLFIDRGWLYPPESPVELAKVQKVTVEQSALARRLKVGTIELHLDAEHIVEVPGISKPELFAEMIEKQIALCQR